MMIKLSTVRDLAATAAGVALAAMAAGDLGVPAGRARRPAVELAPARHGWLCGVEGTLGAQARRLRPATAAEATASASSRAADDGGWFGLTRDGDIVDLADPRFARANRCHDADRVDAVFVAGGGFRAELLELAASTLVSDCTCTHRAQAHGRDGCAECSCAGRRGTPGLDGRVRSTAAGRPVPDEQPGPPAGAAVADSPH